MLVAGKAAKDLPFSFSRKYRLTSKHDFEFVFAKPYKIKRQYLLLLSRPNERAYSRLGIIIGKQFVKRAVDRNGLRRVVRESFRYHKQAIKGLDIIVLIRSGCCPQNKKALRDNVEHLWQQLVISSQRV